MPHKLGGFSLTFNCISIIDSILHIKDIYFLSIIIHELTHAVSYNLFRPESIMPTFSLSSSKHELALPFRPNDSASAVRLSLAMKKDLATLHKLAYPFSTSVHIIQGY